MGIFDPQQKSTQEHLDIEDIRDNLVVLKNGRVSVVLETTSINFDLLADKEQDSKIYTFANLLNALRFPIQIVIRTQQTDVSKYMSLLEQQRQRASGSPLGQQMEIYQDFIRQITSNTQILNKRFYVVVPTMTMAAVQKTNPLRVFFGRRENIVNIGDIVEKAKTELNPKRDQVLKQLDNMGLVAHQMQNDELIKLYYSIYEPEKSGLEVMDVRTDELSGAVVNTKIGEEVVDADEFQNLDVNQEIAQSQQGQG